MNLKKFRIGVRLGGGLSIVLGLAACLFVATLVLTTKSRLDTVRSLSGVIQRKALLAGGKEALLEAAVAMRNMGLATEVAVSQRENANAKERRALLAKTLNDLLALDVGADEQTLIRTLQADEVSLDAPFADAMAHAAAFDPEGAAKIINERIEPLYRRSLATMNRLTVAEDQRAAVVAESSAAAVVRVRQLLQAGGVLTLGIAAWIGWLLTRSITTPIRQAATLAREVAQGRLDTVVTVPDGRDETCDLLRSLAQMAENLKELVVQVRESAESISLASDEVAAGNTDLSQRTEEAASITQRTVSAIEQMGLTVQTNAEHARDASALADTASGVAHHGGEVVTEVVATMSRISESSRKIGDITAVIDSIAFQTNILALNAAVEAARAGEQGRGFAVVAAEVRTLAQRSAGAAREIKQLIGASTVNVQNGSALVDRAGITMQDIVASVSRFSEIMRRVSDACSEQTGGIGLVKDSITRIDDATQRNAALVEQASAASSSVQQQAGKLMTSIRMFQV